jgi:hypothetical protein
MLFIIFGLSLFEIIAGYVLENGVPFSTTSLDNYFFYDIKQNNTNKIINGSVQIGYQVIIPRSMNYFYMAETTGHSETTDNGNSLIDLNFQGGEEDKVLSFNFTFIPTSQKSNAVRFHFNIKTFAIWGITITLNEIGSILILENGISQNITNLVMGQFYYFLISTQFYKNANISLSMNYNTKQPFKELTICEHIILNSKLGHPLEHVKQISFNKVGDNYIINVPYIISLPYSKYISFKIIPQQNIDYINAKIEFGGKITNIKSSNTQFSNLISGFNYGFYMDAKEKQIAKFNFTVNYKKIKPFENVNILEISKSDKILKKTNEDIKSKYMKINNTYVISLEYNIVSYNTYLISLELDLKYDIENLTLYKEINGGVFDCINGGNNRIYPAVGYPYYLYIAAKERQKVNVEGLAMRTSNTNETLINDIYIYEFISRNSSSYNCYQKISDLNEDFPYEIKNKTTKYISLYFVPEKVLSSPIYVKLKVEDATFNCNNGTKSEHRNLLKNNNYYFYINTNFNKYVSINITMDEAYKNSLEYMTIYEYAERYNSDILKETQRNITTKSSNYLAFSYNSYKVISNLTNYVCFKIHTKEKANIAVQIFVKDFNDSYSGVLGNKDGGETKNGDRKSNNKKKFRYN